MMSQRVMLTRGVHPPDFFVIWFHGLGHDSDKVLFFGLDKEIMVL